MNTNLLPSNTPDSYFFIIIGAIFIFNIVIFLIIRKITIKKAIEKTKEIDPKHFNINPYDKYYDDKTGYWDERIFLGKYIDINGTKWDLGIKLVNNKIIDCSISKRHNSNENIDFKKTTWADYSHIKEIKRRLRLLNLDKLMIIK